MPGYQSDPFIKKYVHALNNAVCKIRKCNKVLKHCDLQQPKKALALSHLLSSGRLENASQSPKGNPNTPQEL